MQKLVDTVKPLVPGPVRGGIVRARLGARQSTGRIRSLPDFLIVGGMRCGTSSLYKYLGYHPQVIPALRKEIHYLSIDFGRGEQWYRSHFPTIMRKRLMTRLVGREPLTFEATPDYLFHPFSPHRAAALVPQAKVIALLRNPADRAISHYLHMVDAGYESLPLEQALRREPERLAGERERLQEEPLYRCFKLRAFSYVARGIYLEQLRRWRGHFGEEQVLVIKSEDLFERPRETYGEVVTFLGLRQWTPARFPNYSLGGASERASPDVPPEIWGWLREQFRPHNERLYEFLGRDLGW